MSRTGFDKGAWSSRKVALLYSTGEFCCDTGEHAGATSSARPDGVTTAVTTVLIAGRLKRKLPADACLFRAEHSAAGGDVYATALADGAGDTCGFERALEFDGGGGGGGGAAESVRGVERDEVDVGADAGEQGGEALGGGGGVVGSGDERPLEKDFASGLLGIGAAGGDEFGKRPAAAGGDECGAFLLARSVEADCEMVAALFRREAEDAGDDADGADADARGAEADAA